MPPIIMLIQKQRFPKNQYVFENLSEHAKNNIFVLIFGIKSIDLQCILSINCLTKSKKLILRIFHYQNIYNLREINIFICFIVRPNIDV